jgi:hypothetical protein
MKIIALIALTISLGTAAYAQDALKNWKEMKDFHQVMSQTFHPSEEGNLQPIKTRIGEMAQKAEALKASKVPAELDNKKVRKHINKLVVDSKKLQAKIAAGASDEEITKALSALHDVFHKIVGLCSETEDHGHEGNEGHNHEHGEGGHKHE